jgi:hypothetical protein
MSATIIKELGDGLILRQATERDVESLAEFNSHIDSHDGWDKPDLSVAAWTRDMMPSRHSSVTVNDFTIV